ncbi:hypothetical protein [Paenibacillus sp. DYY-L-2]|uniref:hypothetical protein n=1 Tax=Paenibacillus sp. DYY-L-2 TaxID=3447013 RepID=UPI003F4F9B09
MIRRTIYIFLLLTLLSACDSTRNKDDNVSSQLYALVNNLFYNQYSQQLSEFTDVLSVLTNESENDEKLIYWKGRIEGSSSSTSFVLYSLERTNSNVIDKAIPPELRPSMFSVIEETNIILELLLQLIIEKKLGNVIENKKLVLEIVQLCDEINVSENVIKDNAYSKEYTEKLKLILDKLQEFKIQLSQK